MTVMRTRVAVIFLRIKAEKVIIQMIVRKSKPLKLLIMRSLLKFKQMTRNKRKTKDCNPSWMRHKTSLKNWLLIKYKFYRIEVLRNPWKLMKQTLMLVKVKSLSFKINSKIKRRWLVKKKRRMSMNMMRSHTMKRTNKMMMVKYQRLKKILFLKLDMLQIRKNLL